MTAFIGIDLGTTNSVVAYINEEGKPTAIPNAQGKCIIPSVIYFGEGEPIIGDEAKAQQANGSSEIASFFKRSMGESHFELFFNGQSYTPIDLSALVLQHLKQMAEQYLKQTVTQAVITVPAYFNNMQKEATIKAGKQAGLEVLAIINEPTAAAFAYGLRPSAQTQTVLVYDLGGGTFDVSIIEISQTEQKVQAVDGDHRLGGKDWDDRIFRYLVNQFEEEFGCKLPIGEDYNELLVKAEEAKKALSARDAVEVKVRSQGYKGSYGLTRELFETLTADLMNRTQTLTEQVLMSAKMKWSDLSLILLVGGSTRMRVVKEYVERMSGKSVLQNINPDEAVALGATIQAAIVMKDKGKLLPNTPIYSLASRKKSIDVVSHSLGLIALNKAGDKYINSIVIPKNTPFPVEVSKTFSLPVSQRRENQWEVYMTQGETETPIECTYLGKYLFSSIPFVTGGQANLNITYAYNHDGVVRVSAQEQSTRQILTLSIEPLPHDVPDRFMLPPVKEPIVVQQPLVVYLAFDLSGSMSGTPLEEAKKAAHAFVAQCHLDNTAVGIIGFSDRVAVNLKAGQDGRVITQAINGLQMGATGGGNDTHPFDEIYQLLSAKEQQTFWQRLRSGGQVEPRRFALILTDGAWSEQPRAVRQAKRCHSEGIDIIGIGFGGADDKFLREITSSDQKSVFTDLHKLTETFSTIAQELNEGGARELRI